MRNYDLTFIVASDVTEEDLNGVLAQVKTWVEESKGSVTKVDSWGRRKLAYSIDEYTEGYYVTYDCSLEPLTTTELERNLKLAPKVIRHLLVRMDEPIEAVAPVSADAIPVVEDVDDSEEDDSSADDVPASDNA